MVSIIIPVFNRATTLQETLNSIASQTYLNWECVLVDDGSTDNSLFLIEDYIQKDKRFRVFSRSGNRIKGPSACRNIGLENAKGEYIIYLDSDDLLASFCLEERLKAFVLYPDNDFLVFDMKVFSNGKPKISREELTKRKNQNWLSNFIQLKGSWQTTAPIYKTAFAKNIAGFSEGIMIFEDFEIAIRALYNSEKFLVFNNIDYFYRNDENYILKHKDVAYDIKVVPSYFKFLLLVHQNIISKTSKETNLKYKNDSVIAYLTIFNRYIIPNVELFKRQNKELITFLYKMGYISMFKYIKYLIVQHFLFKFHYVKGVGLYRAINISMR